MSRIAAGSASNQATAHTRSRSCAETRSSSKTPWSSVWPQVSRVPASASLSSPSSTRCASGAVPWSKCVLIIISTADARSSHARALDRSRQVI
ncbi:hypothetical protein K523DRAFT_392150 [Schizophyllum commune Tattone D]|nr:hypothetical protein K523DRAFT_392150 [Schizophyllum commune Tattone D]